MYNYNFLENSNKKQIHLFSLLKILPDIFMMKGSFMDSPMIVFLFCKGTNLASNATIFCLIAKL